MRDATINTMQKLQDKLDLIQNLTDIKIMYNIINPADIIKEAAYINKIDNNYSKLNCGLQTLIPSSDEYVIVNEYLNNSNDQGGSRLKLLDAFKLTREGEDQRFNPNHLENKMLLWHGSRFSNFVGILSQGLRIAPPEAPKTGYMFGKGVYFADRVAKSAPYCCPSMSNNVGILLLCEVALGKTRELQNSDHNASDLPEGCHSTHGIGNVIPDPAETKIIEADI